PREIEYGFQQLCLLLFAGLPHYKEHARAVLDVTWRRQLLLQQIHDKPGFLAVKAARIATPVLLGEKCLCPFAMVVPKLVKQITGEMSSCLYEFSVCGWLNTVFCQ